VQCIIVGGGPSVTPRQVALAREWAKESPRRALFAVNKVFLELEDADYVFSRDTRFVKQYEEQLEKYKGQVIVGNGTFTPPWAKRIDTTAYISGAACIEAAARLGCQTIYLIGADGHHRGGAHWFPDYKNLPNAPNYLEFDEYYADAMRSVQGLEVYNLSPGTAIESVPTMNIDEILIDGISSRSS